MTLFGYYNQIYILREPIWYRVCYDPIALFNRQRIVAMASSAGCDTEQCRKMISQFEMFENNIRLDSFLTSPH